MRCANLHRGAVFCAETVCSIFHAGQYSTAHAVRSPGFPLSPPPVPPPPSPVADDQAALAPLPSPEPNESAALVAEPLREEGAGDVVTDSFLSAGYTSRALVRDFRKVSQAKSSQMAAAESRHRMCCSLVLLLPRGRWDNAAEAARSLPQLHLRRDRILKYFRQFQAGQCADSSVVPVIVWCTCMSCSMQGRLTVPRRCCALLSCIASAQGPRLRQAGTLRVRLPAGGTWVATERASTRRIGLRASRRQARVLLASLVGLATFLVVDTLVFVVCTLTAPASKIIVWRPGAAARRTRVDHVLRARQSSAIRLRHRTSAPELRCKM